jgi:uncharacterized protein (DUF58 family)
MSSLGRGASAFAAIALAAGYVLHWPSLFAIGIVALLAVVFGFISTRSTQSIAIERALHPKKVTKGAASIALLSMRNLAITTTGRIQIVQTMDGEELLATLPPLLGKQSAMKSVPLVTTKRGHFVVGPVTIRRSDIFGFFRREQVFGENEELWVQPSVAAFRPLSTGFQRDLEGPTSDRAPVGNIAFHRIREYVPGDDPRLIHWKATARKSGPILELMVRHNVDTTQPATVVLLDTSSVRYEGESFEEAVDVAASSTRAAISAGGNLSLLTTDGDRVEVGQGMARSDGAILDFLTDVNVGDRGTLRESMLELALSPGGTTLIIVTGAPSEEEVAQAAALSKRFARVILASLSDEPVSNPFPQLAMVSAPSLAEMTTLWNREMAS